MAFSRLRRRLDDLTWEKIVIALAVAALGAWLVGWIAGAIVTLTVGR